MSPHSYTHVSVRDLYISRIGLSILLKEICGPILGIFKPLTNTWMWKLGLRPRNSQKRNTDMGFSLQCAATKCMEWGVVYVKEYCLVEYHISVLSFIWFGSPYALFPFESAPPLSPLVFLLPVCVARLHSLAGELRVAPNHTTAQKLWYCVYNTHFTVVCNSAYTCRVSHLCPVP